MSDAGTPAFTLGYHLGSVGKWLRLLLGVVSSGVFLADGLAEDLTHDGTSVIAQVSGWFLAVLGAYTLAFWWLGPRVLARRSPWVGTVLLYGPILALAYVDLPETVDLAIALYIAVSTLVVVVIRYGGCEVIGIPTLLFGRRYRVYCPWNLQADLADKMLAGSTFARGPKVVAAATMVFVATAFSGVGPMPELRSEPRLVLVGATGAATVGLWGVVASLLSRRTHGEPNRC